MSSPLLEAFTALTISEALRYTLRMTYSSASVAEVRVIS